MIGSRLAARIAEKKARLDALRPLPSSVLAKLRERMVVEWTYNSNAIEGSTMTLQETRLILETGLTIGGKSLREHFEVTNHREAIQYVQALAAGSDPVTPFHVRQIHALALARVDDATAGAYRNVPVRIVGASFEPPEPWEMAERMQGWGDWLLGSAADLPSVDRAAIAHHRLVAIHPFVDGNGRTARLLMNLLLMREGYPPAVIQQVDRRRYYSALATADRDQPGPIVELVARAVENSLNLYLEAATPRAAPPDDDDRWIPLRDATAGTPYSQEYLSLLARTGRLDAVKRGRVWHTTRRAVQAYRASVAEDGATR